MHRGLSEGYRVSPYSSYWSTLTTGAFEVRACSMMRKAYIILAEKLGYNEEE
jgi:hypothetical protein